MKYPFLELATVNAPYMDEIQRRVAAVIASGRYVGGSEVEELEERLKALSGADYAIGVSNGLDALRLILRAYIQIGRLNPGDEVIVPANTYIASVLAISDAGLTPVLVDPDISTSNLDLTLLEGAITSRSRAIMPVHLYGRVCWGTEIERVAKAHNLLVIEDNAQAIGASILTESRGRVSTGALGDAAGFSFYPTKNIGAMGDAGAVTTSDPELAATVRALANYGADRRYHNLYRGFNCRLDPVQAAVLNVKLPHVDEENRHRRQLAETYLANLCALDRPHDCTHVGALDGPHDCTHVGALDRSHDCTHVGALDCSHDCAPSEAKSKLRLPLLPSDPDEMVWHQFVIHTPDRSRLISILDAAGIGWDIHYATPPHLQPCYAGSRSETKPKPPAGSCSEAQPKAPAGSCSEAQPRLAIFSSGLPITEALASTCLSLPISRCTSPEDAREISRIIKDNL